MSLTPVRKLERQGYLSLNQFVKYLQQEHPEAALSYPTMLKCCTEGLLRAIKVGGQWRVTENEAKRWVAEGNFERKFSKSYPTYDGSM